jgi:hypothetical protein
MRDRSKTIASLRRLIERPGTPQEGETARRLLEMMGGKDWVPRPFNASDFPVWTRVFYCYHAYRNERGTICKQPPKMQRGQWWMRIKFDYLKQPRWVPVTSELGCHISKVIFIGNECETLYRMDVDWAENDRQFQEKLRALGIDVRRLERKEDVEVAGLIQ